MGPTAVLIDLPVPGRMARTTATSCRHDREGLRIARTIGGGATSGPGRTHDPRMRTASNKKPRIASGFSTAAGALPESNLVGPEQPKSKRSLMRDRSVTHSGCPGLTPVLHQNQWCSLLHEHGDTGRCFVGSTVVCARLGRLGNVCRAPMASTARRQEHGASCSARTPTQSLRRQRRKPSPECLQALRENKAR